MIFNPIKIDLLAKMKMLMWIALRARFILALAHDLRHITKLEIADGTNKQTLFNN